MPLPCPRKRTGELGGGVLSNGRIQRCFPMNNESTLITVDISSIMQKQDYSMDKPKQDDAAFKAYINASDNQEIK